MKLLDDYKAALSGIKEYFGFEQGSIYFDINDLRDETWGIQDGIVYHSDGEDGVSVDDYGYFEGEYEHDVFTSRGHKVGVYRKDDYTMVAMDYGMGGNKILGIFDNKKELKNLRDDG